MDDVSVFTRLSKIGLEIFPITIENKIKELSVSRQGFLSKEFGGNSVETHPEISKEKFQKCGFGNFMYITLVSEHAGTADSGPKVLIARIRRSTRMHRRSRVHQVSGCVVVTAPIPVQGRTCD